MSHSYMYTASGLHFVDCHSLAEAQSVVKQCETEGFIANVYYWGSCHYEVQYYQPI